nr:septation protein A [uncultured Undibacterium sp.]
MMKFLFDVFPVILFFITYKWGEKNAESSQQLANQILSHFTAGNGVGLEQAPILLATALAIVASVIQISYLLISKKKIDAMLWISFFIITIFGSATIYFQNDAFIKWKPTIIYWCYGTSFLISDFMFKKNLLKMAMGGQIIMADEIWRKLNLIWAVYFLVMGLLNIYVAFNFSQSTWVSFKLYSIGALPAFLILQSFFLAKHIQEPK